MESGSNESNEWSGSKSTLSLQLGAEGWSSWNSSTSGSWALSGDAGGLSGDAGGLSGTAETVVQLIVAALLWLWSIFTNVLVCIVVVRSRRIQSTTNYFVLALAFSDLLLMVLYMPVFFATLLLKDWLLGLVPCRLERFFFNLLLSTNTFVLCCICIDRFYTIIYPLSFKVTRGKAKRMIVAACAIGIVLNIAEAFLSKEWVMPSSAEDELGLGAVRHLCGDSKHFSNGEVAYVFVWLVLTYVAPACGMFIGYRHVFRYIWVCLPTLNRMSTELQVVHRSRNTVPRPKTKMVKMLMLATAVHYVLTMPYVVVYIYEAVFLADKAARAARPDDLAVWSPDERSGLVDGVARVTLVAMVSAGCRPLLYLALNSNFRRGVRETFCMSQLRCYRQEAYAVTRPSTFAKANYIAPVHLVAIGPTTQPANVTQPPPSLQWHFPGSSPRQVFNRNVAIRDENWPATPTRSEVSQVAQSNRHSHDAPLQRPLPISSRKFNTIPDNSI